METAKEIKKEQKVTVLAGTFRDGSVAKAREVQDRLKTAKFEGFMVKPAGVNYIAVCKDCKSTDEAKSLIKQAAEKGIKLCLAKN